MWKTFALKLRGVFWEENPRLRVSFNIIENIIFWGTATFIFLLVIGIVIQGKPETMWPAEKAMAFIIIFLLWIIIELNVILFATYRKLIHTVNTTTPNKPTNSKFPNDNSMRSSKEEQK